MNNKALLRPFDLAQAEAGAAICWSHLYDPVAFVGRCSNNDIAVRRDDGIIETTYEFSLRMKPLFWKEGKPVYAGDKLWHIIPKEWVVVTELQGHPDSGKEGYFVDENGIRCFSGYCTWDKPKSKTIVVRYANVYSTLLSSSRYIGELFTTPDGARCAPGSERSLGVARIEWHE